VNPSAANRCTAPVLLVLGLLLLQSPLAEAEAVRLRNGVRLQGIIVDSTDSYVVIELAGGERRRIERTEIAYVEVEYLESYRRGVNLLAEGNADEAVALLDEAVRQEKRAWARALAVAKLMEAFMHRGHCRLALEQLQRTANDRQLRLDWSHLPIWWFSTPPPADAIARAEPLLSSPSPLIAVTAASYALAGNTPEPAHAVLRPYLDDLDPARRVYSRTLLALRGLYEIDPKKLRNDIDRLPMRQQPGPALALAQIYLKKGAHQEAAHEFLKVAFVHPQRHRLAAYALWQAAQLLERMGRHEEATTLYRELRKRYPQSPEAQAAEAEGKGKP